MKEHRRVTSYRSASAAFGTSYLALLNQPDLDYEDLFSVLVERLDALTGGMRLHKSVEKALATPCTIVPKRRPHLSRALGAWREAMILIQRDWELTYGEWMSLLGNQLASLSKYLIRAERHPNDPDKPGDLA